MLKEGVARVQSPSSINTFKQCPRKYFYVYIRKLKTLPSIHLVRGRIAHSVLEHFFDLNTENLTKENFEPALKKHIQDLLVKFWKDSINELNRLPLTGDQKIFYFEETMMMLFNWLDQFNKTINSNPDPDFTNCFKKLTPIREKQYRSDNYSVRGFIDAIEDIDNEIRLMDYKTSKSFRMSEAYKLQLAIYSLLYFEKHGVIPHKVGIYFLKHKPLVMDVDQELLEFAKREIELVHENTLSKDIDDYPKSKSPLCRWRTGQCDFYGTCKRE